MANINSALVKAAVDELTTRVNTVLDSAGDAVGSAAAAATSETNAAASETNAAASEGAAATSETNAAASESAAATSETNAANSEAAAAADAVSTAADAVATAADRVQTGIDAAAAAASESAAATSETNAGTFASDAEAARDTSQAARDTAATHKTAAEAAAASATSTAAGLTGFDLSAISGTITATAVDVFIYDTSQDSDGGAWRKRCQHTSWYNETLNTATRGSRKEFPAVAVIVAEATKVTIYDGDDPSLPMWMVFDAIGENSSPYSIKALGGGTSTLMTIAALNGQIAIGRNTTAESSALIRWDFVTDRFGNHSSNANWSGWAGTIAQRSTTTAFSVALPVLVNKIVNDIAMTVLPNAPIDNATGLPIPTIAVATDGGVSVIKDDGNVVDSGIAGAMNSVSFDEGLLVYSTGGSARLYADITSDISSDGFGPTYRFDDTGTNVPLMFNSGANKVFNGGGEAFSYDSVGLSRYLIDQTNDNNSMVTYTNTAFTTGWMNGDIKGAFLADTDDTDLVGSGELVTNGTFDTDTSGWTAVDGNTSLSVDSGRLKITSDAAAYAGAYQTITTVIGQRYVLVFTAFEATSTSSNARVYVGATLGGVQYSNVLGVGDSTLTFDFVATTTTVYIQLGQNTPTAGLYMLYDDVSLKVVDADRSVNGNDLTVNGTVTRTAVATGAELVAYSGFSA